MEALGIDLKLIIVQVVNFAILLFVLKRLMYKPILTMLEKRKQEVEDSVKLKNDLDERIKGIDIERDQVMHKIRKEADAVIEEARQKGDRIATQIEHTAREKADVILAKGEEGVRIREQEMRENLKLEVARIAVDVAEQVVGKAMNVESQKEITSESVRRFVNDAK